VNAFYTNVDSKTKGTAVFEDVEYNARLNPKDKNTIGTGLLPSALGITGKTRQNDLDIAFNFTFWTGTSAGDGAGATGASAAGNNTLNIRQAYLTFGDASWGTIKLGRDLGIFGSDAILSDMTLLGVGVGGAAGGSSTLGRIGSGYIYADWKGQISYTSPNWNGFQVTAGVTEGFDNGVDETQNNMGYEAKAVYSWTGDVAGKVWVGGLSQKHESGVANARGTNGYTSRGVEAGVNATAGAFGLVAYYYDGRGLDGQLATGGLQFLNGFKSDDQGGYVQGTFAVPGVGTKLGVSYGQNESKGTIGAVKGKIENESWIFGAYHPLTKSLNLVAEYTRQEIKLDATTAGAKATGKQENDTISLGAIMFF